MSYGVKEMDNILTKIVSSASPNEEDKRLQFANKNCTRSFQYGSNNSLNNNSTNSYNSHKYSSIESPNSYSMISNNMSNVRSNPNFNNKTPTEESNLLLFKFRNKIYEI